MLNPKYSILNIFTDGGSRGNPGPAAIGVNALVDDQVIFQLSKTVGHATNNFAEYSALIESLKHLLLENIVSPQINFFLDSELVVKQINGQYKVKNSGIKLLYDQVKALITKLISNGQTPNISFTHIPREKNKVADSLVNAALDAK